MVLAAAVALVLVIASKFNGAKAFPEWHPPTRGDARSACPGLNAMANHGFIPHDGRNVTFDILDAAVRGAFNFDATPPPSGIPTFAEALFQTAVTNNPFNPSKTSFDLDIINTHNFPIECDGSLSRKDHFFGDDVSYDRPTFTRFWSFLKADGFVNGTHIDVPLAAKGRALLVLEKSQAYNPEFIFNSTMRDRNLGTTALFMNVLSGTSGLVRKDWVWSLFDQERIPYEQGFTLQQNVSLVGFGALRQALFDATPANIPCTFNPETFCTPSSMSAATIQQMSLVH